MVVYLGCRNVFRCPTGVPSKKCGVLLLLCRPLGQPGAGGRGWAGRCLRNRERLLRGRRGRDTCFKIPALSGLETKPSVSGSAGGLGVPEVEAAQPGVTGAPRSRAPSPLRGAAHGLSLPRHSLPHGFWQQRLLFYFVFKTWVFLPTLTVRFVNGNTRGAGGGPGGRGAAGRT